MNDIVTLHAGGTPSAPALVLRPWRGEDVAALLEVFRDPALRHWTSSAVENEGEAMQWLRDQERGWTVGNRFGFAVLEVQPEASQGRLAGQVVLKEVASGKPSAEVGYWTATHARGHGVAPRAVEALTGWAFDVVGAGTLEHLELLHQVDNPASCRVTEKSRYRLDTVLPPGAAVLSPRGAPAHTAQGFLSSTT
ncbi:GNAT family N-acetyltransferase [Streptomyces sp. WMMB303]|uniref:GNAT family N-acetyltransferase n=1 Tax=Streptomyces sp. WMMB303 TaxID=3034154 RepID=UPI0032083597